MNPKNSVSGEELCQWRYNTCGPACPVTCQHPHPLHCSLSCVEGCHAYCPPGAKIQHKHSAQHETWMGVMIFVIFFFKRCYFEGQLLDEVAMRCVNPSDCKVCVHEGRRISHGNKVILNRNDPEHCKIWYECITRLLWLYLLIFLLHGVKCKTLSPSFEATVTTTP